MNTHVFRFRVVSIAALVGLIEPRRGALALTRPHPRPHVVHAEDHR